MDTNVAVVANRRGDESYACGSKYAKALLGIKNEGVLVIDDRGLILGRISLELLDVRATRGWVIPLSGGFMTIGDAAIWSNSLR